METMHTTVIQDTSRNTHVKMELLAKSALNSANDALFGRAFSSDKSRNIKELISIYQDALKKINGEFFDNAEADFIVRVTLDHRRHYAGEVGINTHITLIISYLESLIDGSYTSNSIDMVHKEFDFVRLFILRCSDK